MPERQRTRTAIPRHHRSLGLQLLAGSLAALAATGGARPTGLVAIDVGLLAAGSLAMSTCTRRARTVPVYVAAGAAVLCQHHPLPLALGLLGLVAAVVRRGGTAAPWWGVAAGGLTWACAMGAPGSPAAQPIVVPMLGAILVIVSARGNGSRRFRRKLDRIALGGAAAVLVVGGIAAVAAASATPHLQRGRDLLADGLQAARSGDTEEAIDDLRDAEHAFDDGEWLLGGPWVRPAWVVPGLSQNLRGLRTTAAQARALAHVGATGAADADLASLGAAGGRVDLEAVAAMKVPLQRVQDRLEQTQRALGEMDDDPLLPPVRDLVDQVDARVGGALPDARLALQGIDAAPILLGGDGPATYLVLFTTPVEARNRTGFPGNYAELTFEDGRFHRRAFGRIADLQRADAPEGPLDVDPEFTARWGRFRPESEWRSVTISPDFPTVASIAAQRYEHTTGTSVDGVISMDPVALAALLRFTGPVRIPGVHGLLNATNAAEFLLRRQYLDLPDTPDRIDALETLADLVTERLTSSDLPAPRALGRVFGPVVDGHHLQIATPHGPAQPFLDALGVSGAFRRHPPSDFVSVQTVNAGMNKIDLFLERSIRYEARWDPSTGRLEATATISLTNTAPSSGLPDYLIDNNVGDYRPDGQDLPPGTNDLFLTLYTPWRRTGATLDGRPIGMEELPELGLRATSAVIEIPPGATRTLVVTLEGRLATDEYALDVAHQPTVVSDHLDLSVTVPGGRDLRTTGPVAAHGGEAQGSLDLGSDQRIVVRPHR